MSDSGKGSFVTRGEVLDAFFVETRASLLDIAAFLDRVDRAGEADEGEDFRLEAFRKALGVLLEEDGEKARRVLEVLSDHSTDLPQSAKGLKGAFGAAKEVAE